MHPLRKKKLIIVIFIVCGSASAVALALFALRQNINLYFTPTQVFQHQAAVNKLCRIGGIVKPNSITHGKDLQVNFIISDKVHEIKISYQGILPDLFAAGQGVIVQGTLNQQGVLIADQVLAKHGADYMPGKRLVKL